MTCTRVRQSPKKLRHGLIRGALEAHSSDARGGTDHVDSILSFGQMAEIYNLIINNELFLFILSQLKFQLD